MVLAALAIFVAHHPHSPSLLALSPSLLLPSSSAACSHCLLLATAVIVWSLTLSCQPLPAFDAPVAN
jgi:hypothetical protein